MSLWFTTMAATALLAGGPPPPPAFVAPCPSGVSGGLPASYERHSLVAGPLALYAIGDFARYPSRFIAAVPGARSRFPGFEGAATVRQGGDVTLAFSPADRAHVRFLYDHREYRHAGRGYRVGDGEVAVRLRGCTAPSTQYQGGFVLDGPRCATLELWIDGARTPERRRVEFGTGACGA